tara:strand:- start:1939 stop:2685 length:747 start_codon:yes stop_codon:yes gene_type:complete
MNSILIIVFLFIVGLYFCVNPNIEKFENKSNSFTDCPNLLVQKGQKLFLINTNKVEVPGINPIQFDNLEEYVEYLEWQKNTGVFCPVLYLQEGYNTQNEPGFRILPDPLNPNAGLPSNIPTHLINNISGKEVPCDKLVDASKRGEFNKNSFPGFDPDNQNIGKWTCLEKLKPKNTRITIPSREDYKIQETKSPKYDSLYTSSSSIDEDGEYKGTYGRKWVSGISGPGGDATYDSTTFAAKHSGHDVLD